MAITKDCSKNAETTKINRWNKKQTRYGLSAHAQLPTQSLGQFFGGGTEACGATARANHPWGTTQPLFFSTDWFLQGSQLQLCPPAAVCYVRTEYSVRVRARVCMDME